MSERRFHGSRDFNNAPPTGYASPLPRYISEQGNSPIDFNVSTPVNRRERRLAARAMRTSVEHEHREPTREVLGNPDLPIFPYREEITDAVRDNQVVIVVGETGSGKSTQVPQFLLDAGYDVALTQPRRPAAYNVAERCAQEIATARPNMPRDIVGYHTAEKNTLTENSRIKVLTDGLRYIQQLNDDGALQSEVLVIDEVHEWNTNVEMLVAWTRRLVEENPDMRVVLMSATINAPELAHFYADVTETMPPIIEVPGRTFPIEKEEKAESTIIEELLREDFRDKNILCFLPGKREIRDSMDEVRRRLKSQGHEVPKLLPLHSKMSEHAQKEAFESYPESKIIFATNVAQTSLTIPDIDIVIDSGFERQVQMDDEEVQSLVLHAVSQADCDQRAGRAGRVKNGHYVLTNLNDETKFVPYINRDKTSTPEIRRTQVDRNTLRFACLGLDLETIKLKHSVNPSKVRHSKDNLKALGALNEHDKVTSLGKRMDTFSVRPMYSRMIVESEQYSEATRAQVAAMAAAIESGGLKNYGPGIGRRWIELSDEVSSDLLAQLDIFIAAQGMSTFNQLKHDLDIKNVERAQELYRKIAGRTNVDPDVLSNPNQKERENIKRCIYAGMIDYIYEYAGSDEFRRVGEHVQIPRELSNRSVVRGAPSLVAGTPYRVEYYKGGEVEEHHILENVTKIDTPTVLGEIAMNLCRWTPTDHTFRRDRLMDVQSLEFRGIPVGATREVEAEITPGVQARLVEHIMNNPGSALKELYSAKKRLEELYHLGGRSVAVIKQSDIDKIVHSAVSHAGANVGYADSQIREIIARKGFVYDTMMSPEREKKIREQAPSHMTIAGHDYHVEYRHGNPVIKRADLSQIALLPDEPRLPDGRQIWFIGEHGKKYNVTSLRKAQGVE